MTYLKNRAALESQLVEKGSRLDLEAFGRPIEIVVWPLTMERQCVAEEEIDDGCLR